MSEHKIDIPAPGRWISSNDRKHWAPKARLTKLWRESGYWQAMAAKLPAMERVSITAIVHRTDRRRADAANKYPTIKAAIDGLVDAGVLPDDSDTYVRGLTIEAGDPVSHPHGQLTIVLAEVES